jgi:outer membrane protein OmpA-like peptidoglycan-associated protein
VGVTSDKIITEGWGSKKPIASNKTPQGRQKNRRVEFKIIK